MGSDSAHCTGGQASLPVEKMKMKFIEIKQLLPNENKKLSYEKYSNMY